MAEVSVLRLHVMRAGYLFWAIALGFSVWPRLIDHDLSWPLMNGAAASLLGALAALALLGIRYPLQMLPLLLFELLWKSVWLAAVALPLWRAQRMDADTQELAVACAVGVALVLVVAPWSYVWANYAARKADRWK